VTFSESLTAHAAEYLRACLKQAGGRVEKAARLAGVHRATFYNLCAKCGVDIEVERPPRGHKLLSVWLGAKPYIEEKNS
jgi:DNA-binding NtrC family response regulator